MRRAARRMCRPAHVSTRVVASVRSVFGSCLRRIIVVCTYIFCRYIQEGPMRPTTSFRYGLPTPAEVAGRTGKEILQGIIDGRLPQAPISQTMSFWITEGWRRLCRLRRRARAAPAQPDGRRARRLGANSNRQRRRLRRAFPAAGRLGLHHDRDQGQFCTAHHQGDRARSRGARVVSRGRQVISSEARVLSQDGKVLAHGTTTILVLSGGK
jgi:hypothetical protein